MPETISNPGNEVTATDDTLLGVKKGYFYHAKLKDYSSGAFLLHKTFLDVVAV